MLHVASALNANNDHKPLITVFKTASSHNTLNGVATSNNVTIGLYLLLRSCRVNSQINVDVVKCWIWKRGKKGFKSKVRLLIAKNKNKCLTSEMFDSKHFWMYNQLNSAPRAPTHNIKPRERITSAVAHPKPAVINLLWPLPGIRDKTTANPNKSAISMVHLRNS